MRTHIVPVDFKVLKVIDVSVPWDQFIEHEVQKVVVEATSLQL